jgi:ribosomal protein S1
VEHSNEVFKPGQAVQGKIHELPIFGAFVELIPGIEGLFTFQIPGLNVVHQPSEVGQHRDLGKCIQSSSLMTKRKRSR